MHKLLKHSGKVNIWLEECSTFSHLLQAKSYPARAIGWTFSKVSWNQPSKSMIINFFSTKIHFFSTSFWG